MGEDRNVASCAGIVMFLEPRAGKKQCCLDRLNKQTKSSKKKKKNKGLQLGPLMASLKCLTFQ